MAELKISLPSSWEKLSQTQLRYLYHTMALADLVPLSESDDPWPQIQIMCVMRWADLSPLYPHGDGWIMKHQGKEYKLLDWQLTAATQHLNWAKSLPDSPVRLDTAAGKPAVCPANLCQGFTFDSWLSCEALWQGYMASEDKKCLALMGKILYGADEFSEAELINIFYWWAAVKNMVSAMFPNFFSPSGKQEQAPSQPDLRRAMDAQIRALTKGDITKEKEILAMEAMRALTELDAQAREYDELNKKYPQK